MKKEKSELQTMKTSEVIARHKALVGTFPVARYAFYHEIKFRADKWDDQEAIKYLKGAKP